MEICIYRAYEEMSRAAAQEVADVLNAKPNAVLGMATGSTPLGVYQELVRMHARGEIDFSHVTTFNLDEYVGVPPGHPGSYCTYMKQHLFEHVDLDPTQTHLPNGMAADLAAECLRYEREIRDAGGLELTFLGLGRNGHIGFNEPGTPFDAHTRVVQLTESTRKANAEFFPEAAVPTHAITMGISTILEAKRIVLLVAGSGKEAALERLRSGIVGEDFPASALWTHPDVTVLAAV
jgi:glucosamine-6-phosphate deaminase